MKIYHSQFINGVVCDVVLASEAEARIAELEKALREIENMPVGYSHAESFYQMIHIAKDVLEKK
jgi:hypothetical protein